jgi:hypothetical protein
MHVKAEIDRIWATLRTEPERYRSGELHAAMQALGWALDPVTFRAPFDCIANIPVGSAGCLEDSRRSQSPDTGDQTLDAA